MERTRTAEDIIASWPEESREAAQLVIDTYGEPHEKTGSQLTWFAVGPWKRLVATRQYWRHDFPISHLDSVESFIDYKVPVDLYTSVARFDGSVMPERTTGELSARCHDEQADNLALNLTHDIVTGMKTVEEARDYYAHEFLAYRRREPTPYMDRLRFGQTKGPADPDRPLITKDDLKAAAREGRKKTV